MTRRTASFFAAVLAVLAAAPFAIAHRAIGGTMPVDIIDLAVPQPIKPGETLPCTLTLAPSSTGTTDALTGATTEPTHVVIYSEPAGVVSFEGDVTGSTVTVPATTSAGAPVGTVTVYASTDGQQVVGTEVPVAN